MKYLEIRLGDTIEGNIMYIDWVKKQENIVRLARKKFAVKS